MEKMASEQIIIEAALKVFSTKGYAETRMADIAKEANLSYGLIYHYFENKEKLFDAIVENWWKAFYDELEMLKKSTASTNEKLVDIIKFILNAYTATPSQMSIFVAEVSRGFIYHSNPRGKDKFRKLFALCEDIIREGQTRGALRRDIQSNYLTYVFLGAIDTFLSIMILGNETLSKAREKRIIESLASVFLHGAEATTES
jgi:TetR/AcrR family fatty acid metabolism transcriptional regulator